MIGFRVALLAALLLPPVSKADAMEDDATGRLRVSGEVAERLSYRIDQGERLAEAKTLAKIKAEWAHSPDSKFTGIVRGFYDYVYDRYDAFSDSAVDAHGSELVLRELYWDGSVGGIALRLGKQQVTWGEADFFRVVDVINPLDIRDFLLTYFDDYQEGRLPLWMANVSYQGKTAQTQLVVIPDFEPTFMPEPTTDFAPPSLEALYGLSTRIEQEEPRDGIKNSAVGLRTSFKGEQIDSAFYGYYGWNPDPLAILSGTETRFIHIRRKMVGASLARPIGEVTVRGDFALYDDEPYLLESPIAGATFGRADNISLLFGVDYFGRDWDMSLQVNRVDTLERTMPAIEATRTDGSFSVHRQMQGGRVTLGLLLIHRFSNTPGGMAEFKIDYRVTERLVLSTGADWFVGDSRGLYGQFDEDDRVFARLSYRR